LIGAAIAILDCAFTSKFWSAQSLADAFISMHIVPAATLAHLSIPTSNAMLSAVQNGGSGTSYQLPPLSTLLSTGVMLCMQSARPLQS
jgi:hypothetical protein